MTMGHLFAFCSGQLMICLAVTQDDLAVAVFRPLAALRQTISVFMQDGQHFAIAIGQFQRIDILAQGIAKRHKGDAGCGNGRILLGRENFVLEFPADKGKADDKAQKQQYQQDAEQRAQDAAFGCA